MRSCAVELAKTVRNFAVLASHSAISGSVAGKVEHAASRSFDGSAMVMRCVKFVRPACTRQALIFVSWHPLAREDRAESVARFEKARLAGRHGDRAMPIGILVRAVETQALVEHERPEFADGALVVGKVAERQVAGRAGLAFDPVWLRGIPSGLPKQISAGGCLRRRRFVHPHHRHRHHRCDHRRLHSRRRLRHQHNCDPSRHRRHSIHRNGRSCHRSARRLAWRHRCIQHRPT